MVINRNDAGTGFSANGLIPILFAMDLFRSPSCPVNDAFSVLVPDFTLLQQLLRLLQSLIIRAVASLSTAAASLDSQK